MRIDNVPYADLEQVLLRLGFTAHTVPTSHHYFKHEASGALILLPLYCAQEIVAPRNVALARSTVDDWGIADCETFERMLAESMEQDMPTEPEPVKVAV